MQSQRAVEDADAINEKARHRPRLATSRSIVSPNLGCADNDLVALRLHCFYLALPFSSYPVPVPKLGWSGFAYIAHFIHPGSMGAT